MVPIKKTDRTNHFSISIYLLYILFYDPFRAFFNVYTSYVVFLVIFLISKIWISPIKIFLIAYIFHILYSIIYIIDDNLHYYSDYKEKNKKYRPHIFLPQTYYNLCLVFYFILFFITVLLISNIYVIMVLSLILAVSLIHNFYKIYKIYTFCLLRFLKYILLAAIINTFTVIPSQLTYNIAILCGSFDAFYDGILYNFRKLKGVQEGWRTIISYFKKNFRNSEIRKAILMPTIIFF